MRFTRRSLERVLAVLASALAAASCATVTQSTGEEEPDASIPDEAGVPDALPEASVDGGASDAQPFVPRKVECEAGPCARDLSESSGAFCALVDPGGVACWGRNTVGQLGRGDDAGTAPSGQPMLVEGVEGASSLGRTCAVHTDGSVRCWGWGDFLQEVEEWHSTRPVVLPFPPTKRIFSNARRLCGVLTDGRVLCSGVLVSWGLLPNGATGGFGAREPEFVPLPAASGAEVVDVAVGSSAFALRADGVALSWGSWTALGRASSLPIDPEPRPIALPEVTNIDAAGGDVSAVSAGRLYCWGQPNHYHEQLPTQPTPVPIGGIPELVAQASLAERFTDTERLRGCAVGRSGDVYCWGANDVGQAGDGTRSFALHPVKVKGLSGPAVLVRATPTATCALLQSGRVECWGANDEGALGRGELGMFDPTPAPVSLP